MKILINIGSLASCIIITALVGNYLLHIYTHNQYETSSLKYKVYECFKPDTAFNKISFNITMQGPCLPSYIRFRSINECNQFKKVGGDFWWVRIFGPASFALTLLEDEGVYHREFQVPLEGNYTISLMLEFTNNDGMKDPPKDFYKKGNYQGVNQNSSQFPFKNDYVMAEKKFQFEVSTRSCDSNLALNFNKSWYDQPFCIINNPHGYWINNSYVTVQGMIDSDVKHRNVLESLMKDNLTLNQEKPTLWVMGDSFQRYFFQYLVRSSLLCSLYICENTYSWMYPFPRNDVNAKENFVFNNKDFNHTEFLNFIKNILLSKSMRNKDSVFLINFGIHTMKNLNMSEAESLFDGFIDLVSSLKMLYSANGFPKVIWKTTTPPYIIGTIIKRMIVKQRVLHWNSYCIQKSCQVNMPVLDVFWMAGSYPGGAYDSLHYRDDVFKSAADSLLDILK